jgi:RNA polymerase sigma-70 factor (ECF subfamily)
MNTENEQDHRELSDPETWVDAYGDNLFQFALMRVHDQTLAEDLVQDTLLAAFKGRHTFQGRSSEKTWLIGILKNKILDYFRKKYREQPTDSIEATADRVADQFNEKNAWKVGPAEWTVNPDSQYEQQEFMEVMHQCLSTLPGRLAKLFVLREMEGFSTEKICKALDITATNSWVMLHRARAALRSCLENNWFTTNEKQ